jgi:hypothetical protein
VINPSPEGSQPGSPRRTAREPKKKTKGQA